MSEPLSETGTSKTEQSVAALQLTITYYANEVVDRADEIKRLATDGSVVISELPHLLDIESELMVANLNAIKKLTELRDAYYL